MLEAAILLTILIPILSTLFLLVGRMGQAIAIREQIDTALRTIGTTEKSSSAQSSVLTEHLLSQLQTRIDGIRSDTRIYVMAAAVTLPFRNGRLVSSEAGITDISERGAKEMRSSSPKKILDEMAAADSSKTDWSGDSSLLAEPSVEDLGQISDSKYVSSQSYMLAESAVRIETSLDRLINQMLHLDPTIRVRRIVHLRLGQN